MNNKTLYYLRMVLVVAIIACCSGTSFSQAQPVTSRYVFKMGNTRLGNVVITETRGEKEIMTRSEISMSIRDMRYSEVREVFETTDYKPLRMTVRTIVTRGKEAQRTFLEALVEGSKVTIRDSEGERTLTMPHENFFFDNSGFAKNMLGPEETAVKELKWQMYDPTIREDAPIEIVEKRTGTTQIQIGDKKYDAICVTTTLTGGPGMNNILTAEGNLLRSETEMMGLKVIMELEP